MHSVRNSVLLAMTDLVPVLLFASSMGILIADTRNVVFAIGVGFVLAAALFQVIGKLIAAIRKQERVTKNQTVFRPLMAVGLLLMVIGFILLFRTGTLSGSFFRQYVMCHPAIVFLGFSIVGFCLMGVVRTQHSEEEFASSAALNWEAEGIHIFSQIFLLLTIVFTKINAGTL